MSQSHVEVEGSRISHAPHCVKVCGFGGSFSPICHSRGHLHVKASPCRSRSWEHREVLVCRAPCLKGSQGTLEAPCLEFLSHPHVPRLCQAFQRCPIRTSYALLGF